MLQRGAKYKYKLQDSLETTDKSKPKDMLPAAITFVAYTDNELSSLVYPSITQLSNALKLQKTVSSDMFIDHKWCRVKIVSILSKNIIVIKENVVSHLPIYYITDWRYFKDLSIK